MVEELVAHLTSFNQIGIDGGYLRSKVEKDMRYTLWSLPSLDKPGIWINLPHLERKVRVVVCLC